MEKIEQAKWLVKAFRNLKHETSLWVRAGDKDAAKDLMSVISAENLLLKSLGLQLSDGGRIVKYTPVVGIEREKYNLILKAKNGDTKAAERLLEIMSNPYERQNI